MPTQIHEVGFLWLIPAFPLFGALVNLLLVGRRLPKGGDPLSGWIGVGFMAPAFILGAYAFSLLLGLPADERFLLDHRWTMIDIGVMKVNMAFAVDALSGVMLLVVTGVGTLIHIYAVGYMAHDHYGSNWRFFGYLNLFCFFMLLLILGDNFIVMFFGWEGVGLCSYLLISYYYKETHLGGDPPALPPPQSGAKAFIVNRVGDFAFIVGLFILFWGLGGSWEAQGSGGAYSMLDGGQFTVTFRELAEILADGEVRHRMLSETFLSMSLITAVGVFMFIGATGKSAQIPLYIWLPDAMAGPTPVSALIHAATMVTAGVYMIARLNFIYALSPTAMTVVATTGAATALFAATVGFFQWDIKKVLAYSTVSQLGFMFMGVGVGAFFTGIFHVMTHAFFKACLFLGSGSVIHGCHHEQDMRRMGGLAKYMPHTYRTYLAATLAIAGFPLITAGFWSKDEILWNVFANPHTLVPGPVLWFIGVMAAGGTSFYMMRTVGMTFSGEYRGGDGHGHAADAHGEADHGDDGHGHDDHGHGGGLPHESPITMTGVLMVLAGLSIVGGFVNIPELWGPLAFPAFHHWIDGVIPAYAAEALAVGKVHHSHAVEWGLMAFTVAVGLGSLFLGYKMYWNKPVEMEWLERLSPGFYRKVFLKYEVDEAYDRWIVEPFLSLCSNLARFDTNVVDGFVNLVGRVFARVGQLDAWIDATFVDGAVNGMGDVVAAGAQQLRRVQSGRIQGYAFGMVAGLMTLLVLYQFA